jgi:hypothetical protein
MKILPENKEVWEEIKTFIPNYLRRDPYAGVMISNCLLQLATVIIVDKSCFIKTVINNCFDNMSKGHYHQNEEYYNMFRKEQQKVNDLKMICTLQNKLLNP